MAEYRKERLYWIKLTDRFLTSDKIDFLMSQPNGANYVVLYQMLCLKSVNNDGVLAAKFGELIVPYSVEKIARDCKFFSVDTVRVAMELYKQLGFMYIQEDGCLRIAGFERLIGSQTISAEKKQIQIENREGGKKVEKIPPDKDKYKEIDKEIDKNKEIDINNNIYNNQSVSHIERESGGRTKSPEFLWWLDVLTDGLTGELKNYPEFADSINELINVFDKSIEQIPDPLKVNGITIMPESFIHRIADNVKMKEIIEILDLWNSINGNPAVKNHGLYFLIACYNLI